MSKGRTTTMKPGFCADPQAPVFTRGEIEIVADPESVWSVMSDVAGWPRWNPDVKDAEVDGDVAEGIAFRWKAGPGTIRSTFRVVDRPRALGWTGKTLGIPAIHVYRLSEVDSGTTVVLEESWDGFLSHVFRRPFRRMLDAAVDKGLQALKLEAERRSR